MRKIDLIVVHCSNSQYAHHDNLETIKKWHVEERGWSDIGYHYVITMDGKIHKGRSDSTPGAHVAGHNSNSIGICLTGKDRFSEEQKQSLESLCKKLCSAYNLKKLDIVGHCDLDKKGKTCPNFDVKQLTAQWGWH